MTAFDQRGQEVSGTQVNGWTFNQHDIDVLVDAYSAFMGALLDEEWKPYPKDREVVAEMRKILRKHGVKFERDDSWGRVGTIMSPPFTGRRRIEQ